jgi:hypothetical protein
MSRKINTSFSGKEKTTLGLDRIGEKEYRDIKHNKGGDLMDAREFDYKSVGKKIRHILLDKDATIAKLAEDMGLSRQGLYWKIANDSWTVQDVYKVAAALEIDPKDLI